MLPFWELIFRSHFLINGFSSRHGLLSWGKSVSSQTAELGGGRGSHSFHTKANDKSYLNTPIRLDVSICEGTHKLPYLIGSFRQLLLLLIVSICSFAMQFVPLKANTLNPLCGPVLCSSPVNTQHFIKKQLSNELIDFYFCF